MLERFKTPVLIAVTIAIGVGVVMLLSYRLPPVTITIVPPPPTPTAGPITIYVSGAVAAPDTLITLPPGSRLAAAIEAAGGLRDTADQTGLNPAAILRDGQRVHIPAVGESAASPGAGQPGGTPININSASVTELDLLPGVGPSLAAAIIAYRDAHGPFHALAELDAVPDVGPSRLEQWADLIVFD